MTAPEDPFRTPAPGSQPPGGVPGRGGEPGDAVYGAPPQFPHEGQGRDGQSLDGAPYRQPDGRPASSQPYSEPSGQGYGQPSGQGYGSQPSGQPYDQGYGQQPYGTQPYGAQGGRRRNGLGIAALVLGVLALLTGLVVIGGLLGLVAIVLGFLGRGRVKRGEADNGGMALAGIVLGVLGIVLAGLALAAGFSLLNSDEFSSYTECARSADGDRAALEQCARDFQDQVGG